MTIHEFVLLDVEQQNEILSEIFKRLENKTTEVSEVQDEAKDN